METTKLYSEAYAAGQQAAINNIIPLPTKCKIYVELDKKVPGDLELARKWYQGYQAILLMVIPDITVKH